MWCGFCCEEAVTIAFFLRQIPKPESKLIEGDASGQDMLEMLACDRKSQSGNKSEEW